jgi:hypothetical protein
LENVNIVWKDSYRIFPVSLNELCKVFKVEGKLSKYDSKFNSLDLFNDQTMFSKFIEYSIQDSVSLYKALDRAQNIYSKTHSVDITYIFSTS